MVRLSSRELVEIEFIDPVLLESREPNQRVAVSSVRVVVVVPDLDRMFATSQDGIGSAF